MFAVLYRLFSSANLILISSMSISAVLVSSSPMLLTLPSLSLSNSNISIIESFFLKSELPLNISSDSSDLLISSAVIPLYLSDGVPDVPLTCSALNFASITSCLARSAALCASKAAASAALSASFAAISSAVSFGIFFSASSALLATSLAAAFALALASSSALISSSRYSSSSSLMLSSNNSKLSSNTSSSSFFLLYFKVFLSSLPATIASASERIPVWSSLSASSSSLDSSLTLLTLSRPNASTWFQLSACVSSSESSSYSSIEPALTFGAFTSKLSDSPLLTLVMFFESSVDTILDDAILDFATLSLA